MKLAHALVFLFFLSIMLYLGLKYGTSTEGIVKAGAAGIATDAKALQGR